MARGLQHTAVPLHHPSCSYILYSRHSTLQRCFVREPCSDFKALLFSEPEFKRMQQVSETKEKKNPFLTSHRLHEFMFYTLSSNKGKLFSLPLSPVSISLDTQVLCCFVFSSCNGLPGTCGFCLCFADSSSFLSAAQCTKTLCKWAGRHLLPAWFFSRCLSTRVSLI